MTDQAAPVSHAKPPLPHYAPVSLAEQVKELRKQLAITRNVLDQKVRRQQIHPASAAAELQILQNAVGTLEALEQIAGPNTILSADELRRRLVLQPEGGK